MDENAARAADVVVRGGVIVEIGPRGEVARPAGATVLDAQGCLVTPGLVDLHTHLREPGGEEAETIQTGARAAAMGGYTAVVAMPNTEPAMDCASVVRYVLERARGACCEVAPSGSITLGRKGTALTEMAEMAALGVRIFTDDGAGVADASLMRRAMEYATGVGAVIADHCEEPSLAGKGCMNEGAVSSALGLPGRPAVSEEVMVLRDIALARATGARLHLLHLSAEASVAAVRLAKAAGVAVTAEVAPHHLVLVDEELRSYQTVFKVNPPLRTGADVAALRAALADGAIDAVATDHAPHPPEAKDVAFCDAAPGMVGLETALAVLLTELVDEKAIDALVHLSGEVAFRGNPEGIVNILGAMSWRPSRIAGLWPRHGGPLEVGAPANLCVIDPARRWRVEPAEFASRSRNTPFAGRELVGRVRHTIFNGDPVVVAEEAQR